MLGRRTIVWRLFLIDFFMKYGNLRKTIKNKNMRSTNVEPPVFDINFRNLAIFKKIKVITIDDLSSIDFKQIKPKFTEDVLQECRQFLFRSGFTEETSIFLKTSGLFLINKN